MSWFAAARARLHLLFAPRAADDAIAAKVSSIRCFAGGMRSDVACASRRIRARVHCRARRSRRPRIQVGIGVGVGGILIALAAEALAHSEMSNAAGGMSIGLLAQLVTYGALMFGVCLLACVVPTRRALSVEPTEALRAE